jgi:LDH2 family malate/lactate/ureidoglycolate dehydrogenase
MLNHKSLPVRIDTLRAFMEDLLRAVGLDDDDAATVANIHLESDMRGVYPQGFNHLINSHLQYFMEDRADPRGKPAVVKEGPSFALIDGHSGPGPTAALMACDVAARKAETSGTAIVGITNSHDLFQAGLYAENIARRGHVALIFSDDVVPVVHPLGGTQPIIGSNPLAWAAPTLADPFVIDFTPCATLPTYVRYSQRYGAHMDEGLMHDADGNPTTDPAHVCAGIEHSLDVGAIDPGGNKGYGMLLMIDFLSGALMGADMGMDHITKERPCKGHLLMAINPGLFHSADAFRTAVSARMDDIRGSKKAPGVDAIRMPGDGSFARRKASLEAGVVEIDAFCWEDGLKLAKRLGIEAPAPA